MALAELNIGRLVAPPDDARVSDFVANLERVNSIAKRSEGFLWMMEGSGEPGRGNIDNPQGDNPVEVFNLTVWKDIKTLENFVWNTVHRHFYQRRAEWFEVLPERHFVMWHVPDGHHPALAEGLERLDHLRRHGPSDHAFDWAWAQDATLWRSKNCDRSAG